MLALSTAVFVPEGLAQVFGHPVAEAPRILPYVLVTLVTSVLLLYPRLARRMAGPSVLPDPNQQQQQRRQQHGDDDPPLLQKHSELRSYTTSRFTYPAIRTFYRRHPKADELPVSPSPTPLLVFVHGLGGSIAQFHSLLTSLIHVSSCLAVDLPGCGRSEFAPADWEAYSTAALIDILELVIDEYREKDAGQEIVLIGHSLGAALCAQLASKTSPRRSAVSEHVLGLVAICPPSQPPSEQQTSLFRKLLWIPTPIFDLWRAWDRRGGVESPSVRRFVGADADDEAKKLQHRFNNQSRTPVWRRMAWGSLPSYDHGKPRGGFAGRAVWEGLTIPVYLISGADDHVTPPAEAERIRQWLSADNASGDFSSVDGEPPGGRVIIDSAAPVDVPEPTPASLGHVRTEEQLGAADHGPDRRSIKTEESNEAPTTPREGTPEVPPLRARPRNRVESITLPSPATHALLYTPSTERVLAGLVSDFLSNNVSARLSLGWQLQYLSREGKWDVKNLAKWQQVAPVSTPIAGIFRAMKTLREVDESHCPHVFVANWGHIIKDVVDISHDTPVYDSRGLATAGVRYHKFATVSKIPPTDSEVHDFIALVDRIRAEQQERLQEGAGEEEQQKPMVAVHCHYGFNRTGFFIVCYLVERCGFDIKSAIREFARARPPGIRHQHFIDRLFIRYSSMRGGS